MPRQTTGTSYMILKVGIMMRILSLSFSGPLVSKGIDGDLSAYIPGKKTSEFCCKFLIFQIAFDCFAVAL